MKVFLKSDVECTVDGVGLLKPGEEVEVDLDAFEMYHRTTPSGANFPRTVTVIYDTASSDDEPEAESKDSGVGPPDIAAPPEDSPSNDDVEEEA